MSFSFAYWLTDNSYREISAMREPSSEDTAETRNSFKNIRCPSESEFKIWSAELNMDPIEGPSLDDGCKNLNHRNQLAQILALAKDIKINFPLNWAPTVQVEIRNAYDYLKNNTKKLKIDLTQDTSVARNLTTEKRIELGGLFFKEDPLSAVSVLVHEARHSDSRDQGHTMCRIGDIPKTQGGCDAYFSNSSKDAGAYAYGTLFELALSQYSDTLDKAEKELLLTSALGMLSTRFNSFSTTLAKHYDLLTVLLDDGTLAWVNPYSFEVIPLKIELPKFQEKIKKIEFSPKNNSLIIFTESDRLFVWGPRQKALRPYKEAIAEDDKFIHISRQYVPFDTDMTLYTTLKTNGQLEFIKYDPKKNKSVIYPYPAITENKPVPNLKYFFLGAGFNSYFIDKQGLITRARRYGNEDHFISDINIQSQFGGWKQGTGGVFYEDAILTDSDGKLNQISIKYQSSKKDGEETDTEVYSKKLYSYQAPLATLKYQQGLQFHAVLDESGGLLIENYKKLKKPLYFHAKTKKITDFVITRLTYAESAIFEDKEKNNELMQSCQIKKIVHNLGYGGILGINQNDQLVAANPNQSCTLILENKKWSSAELVGIDDDSNDSNTKKLFPDVYLDLRNQGEKLQWLPYSAY